MLLFWRNCSPDVLFEYYRMLSRMIFLSSINDY